jgi:hypothetical protein
MTWMTEETSDLIVWYCLSFLAGVTFGSAPVFR